MMNWVKGNIEYVSPSETKYCLGKGIKKNMTCWIKIIKYHTYIYLEKFFLSHVLTPFVFTTRNTILISFYNPDIKLSYNNVA